MLRIKAIIMMIVCLSISHMVYAQQNVNTIPKYAVVDVQRVVEALSKYDAGEKELLTRRDTLNSEIQRQQLEIKSLKQKQAKAKEDGDSEQYDLLTQTIAESETNLKNFHANAVKELQQAQSNIKNNTVLKEVIFQNIQSIAQSRGYSMVFSAADPNLLYWSASVDITKDVIDLLVKKFS